MICYILLFQMVCACLGAQPQPRSAEGLWHWFARLYTGASPSLRTPLARAPSPCDRTGSWDNRDRTSTLPTQTALSTTRPLSPRMPHTHPPALSSSLPASIWTTARPEIPPLPLLPSDAWRQYRTNENWTATFESGVPPEPSQLKDPPPEPSADVMAQVSCLHPTPIPAAIPNDSGAHTICAACTLYEPS